MRSIRYWREIGVEADPSRLSSFADPWTILASHLSFGGLLDLPLFLDDLEDLSRDPERLLRPRRRGGDLDLLRRGGEACEAHNILRMRV